MDTVLEPEAIISPGEANDAQGTRPLTIALAGNPNSGKSTLFNALTGLRQKVANYPGVTVERKEGNWTLAPGAPAARLIDLPGLYSLDAASIDERIARDVITGRMRNVGAPDVIVAVVDATNLERNLYLATQLAEHGRPVVIALTMMDVASRRKLEIDAAQLSRALGMPVVPVRAIQGEGLDRLAEAVGVAAAGRHLPGKVCRLSDRAEVEVAEILGASGEGGTRYDAIRELYSDEQPPDARRRDAVEAARKRLNGGDPRWWQEPMLARYEFIERAVGEAVDSRAAEKGASATDRIDRILTHRVFGPLILVTLLLLVFQAIFSWARLPMDLLDHGFGALGNLVRAILPAGVLTDLITDGVIAGVGGIVVFLPQILLLFFFIAILEDTGYMARAAFLMDRLMRSVGLHGKAFMPLLSSFACAIPGIMATRTIDNPRDRIATIMIAPFMSCSARLPVYTLMIAAFFSGRKVLGIISLGALMMMAMYALGITVAIAVAWILKHTILRAPTPPLVLELPPYRVPNFRTIVQAMVSRAGLFLKRAGTVILAISIILWALAAFPRADVSTKNTETPAVAGADSAGGDAEDAAAQGEQLRGSFAGRGGRLLEPVIAPLGFDWKMGIALISSFAARETLVSTLSVIYNVGKDEDERSNARPDSLITAVRDARRPDGTRAWTPLVALSMMIFFVLACQCMSTVAVVRRETNSWRWPLFMVGYMTVLAYVASLLTFQVGRLLGFS